MSYFMYEETGLVIEYLVMFCINLIRKTGLKKCLIRKEHDSACFSPLMMLRPACVRVMHVNVVIPAGKDEFL